MRLLHKILTVLMPLVVLTGCVDSNNRFNPTDPDTIFNLFPSGYFEVGYSEAYELSGFDNNGITQTGIFSVDAQSQTSFNSELAIPLLVTLEPGGFQTGLFPTSTKIEYFSTDSNDLRNLGFTNTLFGSTSFFAFSTSAIPVTAKIGDSGQIGTYIDIFGNENIRTWQLGDGGDGRARLVFVSTTRDNSGFRLSSSEEEYLIDQNGDRVSVRLRFFNADSILTLALSGDKI